MLFVAGWGHSMEILGAGYPLDCPNCHNRTTWLVGYTSRRASLFFVPVAKWRREYWMYCPVCSAALQLASAAEAQKLLDGALRNDESQLRELLQRVAANT